mgnify:CR=1 FL=1
MQRIMNNPDNIVDEMLKGFLKAHSDIVESTENGRVVKAKDIPEGKVGVVTGGGSGHKPAFVGYVGKNMCDAAAVGEICSSPTAAAFLDACKVADQGKGVACLYGNYSGDNMNVKMAVKMAKKAGITVKTVVANDDVASAPKDQREKRRGVAGEVLMWKVGGAKAAKPRILWGKTAEKFPAKGRGWGRSLRSFVAYCRTGSIICFKNGCFCLDISRFSHYSGASFQNTHSSTGPRRTC